MPSPGRNPAKTPNGDAGDKILIITHTIMPEKNLEHRHSMAMQ